LWGSECQILFIDIDVENSIHYIVNFYGRYFVGKTDLWGVSTVEIGHMFNYQSLRLYRAKRLPANEILMAGELTGKALLARLTASGDTISVARYTRDPDSGYNTEDGIFDLAFDSIGNVLSLCKLSSLIHATILKTDIDGNIISRYDLNDINYTSAVPRKFIGEGSDGGYEILMLATSTSSQTGPMIYLYGNGIFSLLDDLSIFSDVSIESVLRDANNRYYFARDSWNSLVYKTSTAGEILWTWVDNRRWYTQSLLNDCVALNGDKVNAVGSSLDAYNLYAVELLPNGQVEVDDDTDSPVVNNLASYPNPMRNKLTIKTQSEAGENATFYVYNIRGQRVRRLALNGDSIEWDGKDDKGIECPNGVYIIRSNSNNSVNYITKVK